MDTRAKRGSRVGQDLVAWVLLCGYASYVANAVLLARVDSTYDDIVEERYHFPKQYLGRISEAVGDWIVYYEPRRGGGRQVYFAMARILRIEPDPKLEGHFYAYIADFVEFPEPVPLRPDGHLLESFLRNADGSTNPGAAINPVRLLSRAEFETICQMGMTPAIADVSIGVPAAADDLAVAETQAEYGGPRRIATISRPLRDAAFARVIRKAYDRTCAMTGLQLVNGGGRCEIEAAHIKPVEQDGPDSPRNGIALSRTVHWLFDRGFLSIGDEGEILQAPKLVPEPVRRLLNPDGRIFLPKQSSWAPHRVFLRYHREVKFKG